MNVVNLFKNSTVRLFALFSFSCFAASQADIPGLSLVLIAIWMQIGNQLRKKSIGLTKRSQLFFLKYFVACLPVIFIIGGVNGFFPVFLKNFDFLKLLLIVVVQLICCWLAAIFMIFAFLIYDENDQVNTLLMKLLSQLRSNLKPVLQTTVILWTLTISISFYSTSDYLWVYGYAVSFLVGQLLIFRNERKSSQ